MGALVVHPALGDSHGCFLARSLVDSAVGLVPFVLLAAAAGGLICCRPLSWCSRVAAYLHNPE